MHVCAGAPFLCPFQGLRLKHDNPQKATFQRMSKIISWLHWQVKPGAEGVVNMEDTGSLSSLQGNREVIISMLLRGT